MATDAEKIKQNGYWIRKSKFGYELRQIKFKDKLLKDKKEDPRDVCAYNNTRAGLIKMIKSVKLI